MTYTAGAPPMFDRLCEGGRCYHDLARGALVWDELLDRDGPYPPTLQVINTSPEALPPSSQLDTDPETVYSDTQATEETD